MGQKGVGRTAENHYPTMSMAQLAALPVGKLAAENCAMFLWVTFPNLPDAFTLLQTWGFQYKSVAFVWVKRNRKSDGWFWGLGHWTRANAEICLLACKGRPQRVSRSVHQIIDTPIQAHSQKPKEARERIVQLMGDVPRIELFARSHPEGWDVWGNEAPGSIVFP